jgi:hypothetical protein
MLVDPYERYPKEEQCRFPQIEKENKSFGTFVSYVLQNEYEKGNKIFVWNNDTHLGVMKKVPKSIYKLFKGKLPKSYNKIYVCGFHYDMCVDRCANQLHFKYSIPKHKIGIIFNLSIPHPGQKILDSENFFTSDFQLYYWTNLAFIPIKVEQI